MTLRAVKAPQEDTKRMRRTAGLDQRNYENAPSLDIVLL
jgi:hypothetical protein